MSNTCDVLVIGSGAGGARCAIWPSGKRILPLERGDWLTRERQTGWRKTCSSMAATPPWTRGTDHGRWDPSRTSGVVPRAPR